MKTKRETMQRSTLTGRVFIGFWNASTFIDSLREAVKNFILGLEYARRSFTAFLETLSLSKNVLVRLKILSKFQHTE